MGHKEGHVEAPRASRAAGATLLKPGRDDMLSAGKPGIDRPTSRPQASTTRRSAGGRPALRSRAAPQPCHWVSRPRSTAERCRPATAESRARRPADRLRTWRTAVAHVSRFQLAEIATVMKDYKGKTPYSDRKSVG